VCVIYYRNYLLSESPAAVIHAHWLINPKAEKKEGEKLKFMVLSSGNMSG